MRQSGFVTLRGTDPGSDHEYSIDVRYDVVEAIADFGSGYCMLITSHHNRLWVKGARIDIVAQLERAL